MHIYVYNCYDFSFKFYKKKLYFSNIQANIEHIYVISINISY